MSEDSAAGSRPRSEPARAHPRLARAPFRSTSRWRSSGKRILITGAEGSIGSAVAQILGDVADVIATDKHSGNPAVDVRVESDVASVLRETRPEIIFHLAAAKSAPDGERDPMSALEVNVLGTRNVLRMRRRAAMS